MADGSLFGRVRGPIVVDLFAGGGGASLGIAQALGVSPVVAINHCPQAIVMHGVNHPETEHFTESVFDVSPLAASRGRRVDLLWASPTCTHFSRARGARPVSEQLRVQGWIVVDWARDVRPQVIICENVMEWETWGPLDERGEPDKSRAGETFKELLGALRGLGYAVEYRMLVAADYGAPTIRKRLFLVARCDGHPIVWPEATHGPGRPQPWRSAAECIDWSLPMPSIFTRRRPLAEATQRRIAEGVRRYVLGTPDPFLLCLSHGGRLEPLGSPMRTVTAGPVGGDRAVVAPVVMKAHSNGSDRAGSGLRSAGGPLGTNTTTEQFGVLAVTLRRHRFECASCGGRYGIDDYDRNPTCPACGSMAAFDHLQERGGDLYDAAEAEAAAFVVNTRNGEREGQRPRVRDIREPTPTVTAEGSQGALVAAFLAKHYGGVVGHELRRPLGTVTAIDHHSLVTVEAVEAGGTAEHAPECAAFLMKYFGTGGQWSDLRAPMPTITAREGLAVVTVDLGGTEYVLTDIGMRMLQPRELARAQGFPDSYVLTGTKGQQIERIGNSVCPPVARALVEANLGSRA